MIKLMDILNEAKESFVVFSSTSGTVMTGQKGVSEREALKIYPVYKKVELNAPTHLSNLLSTKGFNEIISYSFISKEDHDLFGEGVQTLEVENPISQNMTVMRTNLVSGLVSTFLYNFNHGQESQRLF